MALEICRSVHLAKSTLLSGRNNGNIVVFIQASLGIDFRYRGQDQSVWDVKMVQYSKDISLNFDAMDSRFQYLLSTWAALQRVGARLWIVVSVQGHMTS